MDCNQARWIHTISSVKLDELNKANLILFICETVRIMLLGIDQGHRSRYLARRSSPLAILMLLNIAVYIVTINTSSK